jgi:hypothetical protein
MGSSYVMLVALFNHNREFKVEPFLDFIPILSEISVEWGSKLMTVRKKLHFCSI